jgi:hypothetical protein
MHPHRGVIVFDGLDDLLWGHGREALGRVEQRRSRRTTIAHEVDSALTSTESPTEPQGADIPLTEALTGQPLINQGAVAKW